MIDTSKYEGHTSHAPWDYDSKGQRVDINSHDDSTYKVICSKVLTDADGRLIADAPLILSAYKWLCSRIRFIQSDIRSILSDYPNYQSITELIRHVPEDEWDFEQELLVRMQELSVRIKELIE